MREGKVRVVNKAEYNNEEEGRNRPRPADMEEVEKRKRKETIQHQRQAFTLFGVLLSFSWEITLL